MPNPLHTITKIFKDHFTCDDKDIYIDAIKLLDHCATELDGYDYETNTDGDKLHRDLIESVDEYEKSQREDEDAEPEVSEDDDKELDRDDDDDDDKETPLTLIGDQT